MAQKKIGRKTKIKLTQSQIKKAGECSGRGVPVEQIASILGVSKRTLERRMKDQPGVSDAILKGRALAADEIMAVAFNMAKSGLQPAMTMFWLKCRAGWKDKVFFEDETDQPTGPSLVIDLSGAGVPGSTSNGKDVKPK